MKLKPLTDDEIESIAATAIEDATDFIEAEITPARIKAQEYFDGLTELGYEEGRSRVVATKVRDNIRAIKPSLMRVFMSTDKPVEFVPRGPEDIAVAEQATQYIHYKFHEADGFKLLSDVFQDALVKKTGIVKVYYEDYSEAQVYTYSDLTEDEFAILAQDDDIQVLEHSKETVVAMDEMGVEVSESNHSLKIARVSSKGKLCVESVPPEEFFVDRNARAVDDAYCVAHRREMRVYDLMEMGYDFDDVIDFAGVGEQDTMTEEEEFARRGYYNDYNDDNVKDPAMRPILVTEAYMRIDVYGNGFPLLHRVLCVGNSYKMLDYMPCDEVPFAIFEVDPEPHAFFGRSQADLILNDQDVCTSVMRGILDNVALTNNPRQQVIEDLVNMDDVLNNEIGAIVRVKQAGAIQDLGIPFIAGTTLPALQYLDEQVDAKTGVSGAFMGLNPEAFKNTTATAVAATMQAAAGQVEVIARNLAEGGLKRMYSLMLKEVIKNTPEEEIVRLNGKYVPVDPRVWNASMDVSVNVGLGTGKDDQKMALLQQARQFQMQIMQGYGPQNGLVTLTQIRNTLADMLALAGIRNADRHFTPMDPQTEQLLLQRAQQAQAAQAQQQGNPAQMQAQAIVQGEQIKAQAKAQTDMAKLQQDGQIKMAELSVEQQQMNMDDDLARDKLDQDLLVDAAKVLGQYGTQVDVAAIKAAQNANRQ